MRDEFEKADIEVRQFSGNQIQVEREDGRIAYRKNLIKQYHGGAESLSERLRQNKVDGLDGLLNKLLEELLVETDNLLGNSLIASENGDIRDSTVISHKRAEMLRDTIKLIQAKQQMSKEGGIDFEGPAMDIIFKFFFTKVNENFDRMGLPVEQKDLFFQTIGSTMESWKKDLKFRFEDMRRQNGV